MDRHRTLIQKVLDPSNIREGLKNPIWAYERIRENLKSHAQPHQRMARLQEDLRSSPSSYVVRLAKLMEERAGQCEDYHTEISNSTEFQNRLQEVKREFESKPFSIGAVDLEGPVLYTLMRVLKPEVVVEVGVANGVSSYYILEAMDKNDQGRLVSIDLPKFEDDHSGEWSENAGAWIPSGRNVGWVVPDEYRSRWDILIEDVEAALPRVLESADDIDAFVYDGPKRYSERKGFFQLVHSKIGDSCVYVCDDLAWNTAFEDFVNGVGLSWEAFGNVGVGLGSRP